jgi:hypothetical protein
MVYSELISVPRCQTCRWAPRREAGFQRQWILERQAVGVWSKCWNGPSIRHFIQNVNIRCNLPLMQ